MKYRILLPIISVLFVVNCFAQQNQYTIEKLSRFMPVSPNAASLGIFGSIPVGHHTGIPQISIPIHEIDFHGLRIPIELNYHASGIRVAQEASSVGLGWALNAGGCILRNIQHLDDFDQWGYYQGGRAIPPYPEIDKTHDDDLEPLFDSRDYLPFMGYNGSSDAEPDFFSYSFCSHSGSFFLKPLTESNGIASLMGKENTVQIQYIRVVNKWEVVDAYGFKYIFGSSTDTRETTQSYSMAGGYTTDVSSINRSLFSTKKLAPSVTAWYLETIISPFNDTIQFKYKKERILSQYRFSEENYHRIGYGGGIVSENFQDVFSYGYISYSSNEQLLLSSIEYDGGSVEFGYELRNDLQLSNVTNIAQKLTSVSVYENLTDNHGRKNRVKHCILNHSYMGGSVIDSKFSRLMLDEVRFMSINNSDTDMKRYQFTYQSGNLPSKYSQAVDYWGYYNGEGYVIRGTRTYGVISPIVYVSDNQPPWNTPFYIGGQKRTPNENYAKYGILKSIKYPTGGKTVFEFELNDFFDKIQVGTPTGNVNLSRGAGLRIKQISDYANDTEIASVRRFVYQKNGVSSGRLKMIPQYSRLVKLGDSRIGTYDNSGVRYVDYMNVHSEPFSSPLNAGNIGYSYVEEHHVANNKNIGYTAYQFANHTANPKISVFGVPAIINSRNGNPLQVIHYNSDGVAVKKQTFDYRYYSNGDSITGIKCYIPPMYDSFFIFNNKAESDFKVAYYSMYSNCSLMCKMIEEECFSNGAVSKTAEYDYDGTFNLKNRETITMHGDVYDTYLKYPWDFTDDISNAMKDRHIIGTPLEAIQILNGSVIDAQKTVYSAYYVHDEYCYLPESIYRLRKTRPYSLSEYQNYYDKEVQIDAYDSYGNVLQYTDRNNLKVVYLWNHGIYPIAMIKNATVSDVDYALINLNIDIPDLCLWRPDLNHLSGLQEYLPNAQVTLFTHKPQMGVTSISAPSGKTVYYDYDGLGRLIHVKNSNNHNIESYDYNYSNK